MGRWRSTVSNWTRAQGAGSTLAVGALPIAALSFVTTQYWRIIDPRHIGWMWGSGDISSSFIQWLYFRQTPLGQWPLTINPNYGSPWTKTIIFTDTPPLFAIPAKYLTAWVDGPLQYTGLQILLSTYLLVLFGALFIHRLTGRVGVSLVGGLLVSVSPMLLFRDVFFHYSLNVMWVIPAAFYLMAGQATKLSRWGWALLVFITLTWMPYFLVCVLVPWLWDLVSRRVYRLGSWRGTVLSVGVVVLAVFGGVIVNALWFNFSGTDGFGLGYYNANLTALINPLATQSSVWSQVLPTLPTATDGQYEGFAYLGVGALLLAVLCGVLAIFGGTRPSLLWSAQTRNAIVGALLTSIVMSWGFSLTLAETQLIAWSPPEWIGPLVGTFRSSGRFMLVVGLGITLLLVATVASAIRSKAALIVVLLATGLTLADAWPQVLVNRNQQATPGSFTPGTLDIGRVMDQCAIQRVQFINPEDSAYQWKMDILGATALRGIPVNDAFVARPNLARLDEERLRTTTMFRTARPGEGDMWVVYPEMVEHVTNRFVELSGQASLRRFGDAVVILGSSCKPSL